MSTKISFGRPFVWDCVTNIFVSFSCSFVHSFACVCVCVSAVITIFAILQMIMVVVGVLFYTIRAFALIKDLNTREKKKQKRKQMVGRKRKKRKKRKENKTIKNEIKWNCSTQVKIKTKTNSKANGFNRNPQLKCKARNNKNAKNKSKTQIWDYVRKSLGKHIQTLRFFSSFAIVKCELAAAAINRNQTNDCTIQWKNIESQKECGSAFDKSLREGRQVAPS